MWVKQGLLLPTFAVLTNQHPDLAECVTVKPDKRAEQRIAFACSEFWLPYRALDIASNWVLDWIWGCSFLYAESPQRVVNVYVDGVHCITLDAIETPLLGCASSTSLVRPRPLSVQGGLVYIFFSTLPVSLSVSKDPHSVHTYSGDKQGGQVQVVEFNYSRGLANVHIIRRTTLFKATLSVVPEGSGGTKQELETALDKFLGQYVSELGEKVKRTSRPHRILAGDYGLVVYHLKKQEQFGVCSPYRVTARKGGFTFGFSGVKGC